MPQTDSPLVYPLPEDPREHKRALYEQVARVGKACSQPVRLEILEFLAQCPRTVETLTDLLQIDYKNVSAHLKVLLQVVVLQQTARVTEVAAASHTSIRSPKNACARWLRSRRLARLLRRTASTVRAPTGKTKAHHDSAKGSSPRT